VPNVFYQSASELATLINVFKVNDTPTDPTSVSLTITSPTGVTNTYTDALHPSVGTYTKDIVCDEAGTWTYEWVGTGTAQDVEVGTWQVFESDLGHLYCTVAMLRSALGLGDDRRSDLEVHQACFAASRAVEQYTKRVFYRSQVEARTFKPESGSLLKLPDFNDIVSVTQLATGSDGTFPTIWSASDYLLEPTNRSGPEEQPITRVRAVNGSFPCPDKYDTVEITGVWGWPTVPRAIQMAALMLAKETFKSKDAFGGVAGFGEFGVVRMREDPMLKSYAAPYKKHAALVA